MINRANAGRFPVWLGLFCVVMSGQTLSAQEIDFNRDISPILEERCLYCHGEDEAESGLRLDLRPRMLKGGDTGLPTIVPGNPEKSFLIEVINHVEEDMAMPPDDEKLSAKEIDLLTRWIKEGANWPGQMDMVTDEQSEHWSFQPLQRPEQPEPGALESDNPVDAFLLDRLHREGLSLSLIHI